MKRAAPWSDGEEEDDDRSPSDTDSSTLDTDTEDEKDSTEKTATKSKASSKLKASQVESANKKQKRKKGIDLEALRRHGYKGGLSVMGVPPPREAVDEKQDWSWSRGLETRAKETEETFTDRQMTRAAILQGEQLLPNAASTARDKRELSFSQKEKRKRDLGQASRGKNYVEEEKRLLRESGIYSGFDS
ncbi:uncharacterized protein [Coffea arabica]|uniref:Uncharacterized protein n=1 Tax=Coffea arabica TaxID=13443 RepID=A0A6P6UZJ3_COFAR